MKHLQSYCLLHNVKFPSIIKAKEGDIKSKGALARADKKDWTIYHQPWVEPSDYILAHEMAHLLTDGDHGKEFAAKQLEIEQFFAQKRREERRKK